MSTTDDRLSDLTHRSEELAHSLDEKRQKARALLSAHSQRLADLEKRLARELNSIHQRQSHLRAKEEDLRENEKHVGRVRKELDEEKSQLGSWRKAVEQREADAKNQRRRIARDLRSQRDQQLAEIQRLRQEVESMASAEQTQLQNKLREIAAERDRLLEQLSGRHEEASQLAEKERELASQQQEIERLRDQFARVTDQLHDTRQGSESELAEARAALAQSRKEEETLERELAESRQELAEQAKELDRVRSEKPSGSQSPDAEDLKARLKMAVDEVRELRSRNAELDQRLKDLSRGGSIQPAGGAMDWEAQKKRMLAQLEGDFDQKDPEQAKEKLKIEKAIEATNQVVAKKDQEISRLKATLAEQQVHIGQQTTADGQRVAAMLDGDELIRHEREKLNRLQQEWQEKLRTAEVEMAVERAKIGRERSQLETQLRDLQEKAKLLERSAANAPAKNSTRRRWLSQLGLGSGDETD